MTLEQLENHLNNMRKEEIAYLYASVSIPDMTSARIIALADVIKHFPPTIKNVAIQSVQTRLGY